MAYKKLPVGVDDFKKVIEDDYYYVDKTGMIIELLNGFGEVNLFTRPRRFGKSLNMSMLKYFFEIGADPNLFQGLDVCQNRDICSQHMGQYPVICISLKQVYGKDIDSARKELWSVIMAEAERFDYLQDSTILNQRDKQSILNLSMGEGNLHESLFLMSRILYREHQRKVIILIDEYDVPLQKAEENGFYREMVDLISQFFGYSMKSNPYMKFAVVTGCLRISKESIFTGFNNPKIHTIADERYEEWFGFTDREVLQMLNFYKCSEYFEMTKEWYDGYLFGNQYVYCPWDVINWCDKISNTSNRIPENFWANSSGNTMIRRFAEMADDETRLQIEDLIAGKSVWKTLNFEMTYDELDESIENVWSVLFMTGYLTYKGRDSEGRFELILPNREVKSLMQEQISKWFSRRVMSDSKGLTRFCEALITGDVFTAERYLNGQLSKMISVRDTQVPECRKENFYHGMLLGILGSRSEEWDVVSNAEGGDGYTDIRITDYAEDYAFVLELKYADNESGLLKAAESALEQIRAKNYKRYFTDRGMTRVTAYGIAFYKKRCKIIKET